MVHFVLELAEILVVPLRLIVILIHSDYMVLLSNFDIVLDFSHTFLVHIELVSQYLVARFLLFENEI